MKFKKLSSVLLISALAISLTACTGGIPNTDKEQNLASSIINYKFTSTGMGELQGNYDKLRSQIPEATYDQIFDLSANPGSVAIPSMVGVKSFSYTPYEVLTKIQDTYTYVYVLGTLERVLLESEHHEEEDAIIYDKVVAKFTFKDGKLVDYTEM
ncbi:hypothetical protein ABGV42_01920 [Paenibacillus pabuli]|uniref:hypothetical protein n=1 Tax=Paenibacillus pabuli TaxID=1472 RepID=UPI003241F329